MKKRLLSLALCLAMLLPTLLLFTSCQEQEVEEEGKILPMTIVIALMTDEKTNDAGIEATEKALNRITENNFNTHVELKLFTENEYYAKVEEALVARRDAVNGGDTSTSIGKVDDKIYDEEKNREVTAYPETYENQIDIFFVGSHEKLVDYVLWKSAFATDEEYAAKPLENYQSLVAELDTDMYTDGAVGTLMSKYFSTGLLNAGKVGIEGTSLQYAIPSNGIYNNGEYMVVDKALFDSYSYSIEEVSDVVGLEGFLADVAEDHPDVTPLYNLGTMGFVSLTGKNSILASKIDSSFTVTSEGVAPVFMGDNLAFKTMLSSIRTYTAGTNKFPVAGNDLSAAEAGKFAVGFVSATEAEIAKYKENYYVIETNKAMVTTEQACSNMLAVSAFTSDISRCVEIINLLQTNKEAHNILVYGEENTTYTVDDSTKMVKRQYEGDAVYVMDINKTGNLFLTKQNTDMSVEELLYSANDWALAKSITRHVFFGPFNGFVIKYANEGTYPATDYPDVSEAAYYDLLKRVFEYDTYATNEEGQLVDAEGNPLKNGDKFVTTYAEYVDWVAATMKVENPQLGGQATAGGDSFNTIGQQFIKWRKLHHLAPV